MVFLTASVTLWLGALSFLAGAHSQQEGYEPARYRSGAAPGLVPLAQNGGLVTVEAQVTASGIVKSALVVDDAPPFTDEVTRVVRLWRFQPARVDGEAVPSKVSVVALYRAPILTGGEPPPPKRVERSSGEAPYPTSTTTPEFPPQALFEGVVMIEVEVEPEGGVASAKVLSASRGFTEIALEAARAFRFQPAEIEGQPVRAYAVLVFGFPQPLTEPVIRR